MMEKPEWVQLSKPDADGRALCFRYWDGGIHLETCIIDQEGNIARGRPVGLFNEDDILALAGHLPEVASLIKAAKRIDAALQAQYRGHHGLPVDLLDSAKALSEALAPFSITGEA